MPEAVDRDEEATRQVEALKRAVGGLRDVIYDLRLQSAQEQPLIRTLESIVELNRQMAPGCAFELVVDGEFPATLSGQAGLEVARIVQEALANVRRHSGTRHATVALGTTGDEAWVEIEDDGRGLDQEGPPGMGLTGMRERAATLGGSLRLRAARRARGRARTSGWRCAPWWTRTPSTPTLESSGCKGILKAGIFVTSVRPVIEVRGGVESHRLLLVEDHASFRQTLALVFDQQPDFQVVAQAGTLGEARRMMRDREADLGVIDLALPNGEGAELIEEMCEANPSSPRWS
jgi:two-component sensor histidine kinase